MSLQDQVLISAVIALVVILALLLARNRLGRLNTASWLVILGALVIVSEHGQFALSFTIAPTAMYLHHHWSRAAGCHCTDAFERGAAQWLVRAAVCLARRDRI